MQLAHKQSGFTLIELMISIVIGLIVVAGGISFYVATIKGSTYTHRMTHLTQDSDAIMQLMTNELRRTGKDVTTLNLFPAFSGGVNSIESDCILYTYFFDSNGDGVDDTQLFSGFDLDGNIIKMKTAGTDMNTCATGTWAELSDSSMLLYSRTDMDAVPADVEPMFLLERVQLTGVDVRTVTIGFSATSTMESSIFKSSKMQVHLRNHDITP